MKWRLKLKPQTINNSIIVSHDQSSLFITETNNQSIKIPFNGREKRHLGIPGLPKEPVIIKPQPGRQTDFLKCNADYAIYGGAAGGGKSFAIILDAMRGVADPFYNAVLFRRTYPMLRLPGGLIDRSNQIYRALPLGEYNISALEWSFNSGAKIVFRHLQHDKNIYDYQGAEFTAIYLDELTHFPESAWDYLSSRLRSPQSSYRPYMRASTNPDADSWVARQIEWWIDQATGFPIQERAGVIRWFVRIDGETIWANDPDDLNYDTEPKSFTFLPAKLTDNPALLENDPGYLATLQALHPVERARLLHGNWKVRFAKGLFFQRQWFKLVDSRPVGRYVRFWDIAATDSSISKSACYTAGVLMCVNREGYTIVDVVAEQYAPDRVYALMLATAQADGYEVSIRWEKQPAAAGKFVDYELIELLDGFDATWQDIKGSKIERALPWARQAAIGRVNVKEADWNDRFFNWILQFPDSGADIVDAVSGAYRDLFDSYTEPVDDTPPRLDDGWGRFY